MGDGSVGHIYEWRPLTFRKLESGHQPFPMANVDFERNTPARAKLFFTPEMSISIEAEMN